MNEFGANLIYLFWLPILIWTVISIISFVLIIPIKQAHFRYYFALISLVSLPISLLISTFVPIPKAAIFPSTEIIATSNAPTPHEIQIPEISPSLAPTINTTKQEETNVILWHISVYLFILAILFSLYYLYKFFRINLAFKKLLLSLQRHQTPFPNHYLSLPLQKKVRIFCIDYSLPPITYGLRKPTILLPKELVTDETALALVLAHESIHIQRYDSIWQGFETILLTLFAIHPWIHFLVHQTQFYREVSCDATVLNETPFSKKTYASLLYDLLSRQNITTLPSLSMVGKQTTIVRRIHAMKNLNKPFSLPQKISLLTVSIVFAGLLLFTPALLGQVQPEKTFRLPNNAQTSSRDTSEVYVVVEEMPKLVGGMEGLQSRIIYPQKALDANVEGRIFVEFIVRKEGIITDTKIIGSLGYGFDEEALRLINSAQFVVGKHKKKPVDVIMTLPLSFRHPNPQKPVKLLQPTSQSQFHQAIIRKIADLGLRPEFSMICNNYPQTGSEHLIIGVLDPFNEAAIPNPILIGNYVVEVMHSAVHQPTEDMMKRCFEIKGQTLETTLTKLAIDFIGEKNIKNYATTIEYNKTLLQIQLHPSVSLESFDVSPFETSVFKVVLRHSPIILENSFYQTLRDEASRHTTEVLNYLEKQQVTLLKNGLRITDHHALLELTFPKDTNLNALNLAMFNTEGFKVKAILEDVD